MCRLRDSLFRVLNGRRNAHARPLDNEHDVDADGQRSRNCRNLYTDVASDDGGHDVALDHAHAAPVSPGRSLSRRGPSRMEDACCRERIFFRLDAFRSCRLRNRYSHHSGCNALGQLQSRIALRRWTCAVHRRGLPTHTLEIGVLKHCRDPLTLVASHLHRGPFGALRFGIHHGAFCAACCWGLMMIQLVLGVMNLTVMVAVAAVIALEKLLPRGDLIVRLTGAAAILGGLVILAKAAS